MCVLYTDRPYASDIFQSLVGVFLEASRRFQEKFQDFLTRIDFWDLRCLKIPEIVPFIYEKGASLEVMSGMPFSR